MTNDEKIKKYDEIVKELWLMATAGNLLQSTMASALIQNLKIESPDGDDPESA